VIGAADFTLLIPTYDRTAELGRLLRYLARHSIAYPILVLDSSHAAPRAANRALIEGLDLDVRTLDFDSRVSPFEKFWRGSEQVATAFCALCADDDIVLVDALDELIAFLQSHPDFHAAHGLYFNFVPGDPFRIGPLVYAGPSIAANTPVLRLRELLQQYEPVTYAVCGTEALRRALGGAQVLDSLMARELTSGALMAIGAKIMRCPRLYYGRSEESSLAYERWHPIEYLVRSPEDMVEEHARSRHVLADAVQKAGDSPRGPGELLKLIDLISLRYLAAYASPEALDCILEGFLEGRDPREVLARASPFLTPDRGSLADFLRRHTLVRQVRARLAPNARLRHLTGLLGRHRDRVARRTTTTGRPRRYLLYGDFLRECAAVARPRLDRSVDALLDALDGYE